MPGLSLGGRFGLVHLSADLVMAFWAGGGEGRKFAGGGATYRGTIARGGGTGMYPAGPKTGAATYGGMPWKNIAGWYPDGGR
jgi:hypothetical protein